MHAWVGNKTIIVEHGYEKIVNELRFIKIQKQLQWE